MSAVVTFLSLFNLETAHRGVDILSLTARNFIANQSIDPMVKKDLQEAELKIIFDKIGPIGEQLVRELFAMHEVCVVEITPTKLIIWKCHSSPWQDLERKLKNIQLRIVQESPSR